MKMKNLFNKVLLISILILIPHKSDAGLFDVWPLNIGKKSSSKDKANSWLIITNVFQEKQHQLNVLKKEKENLSVKEKEILDSIQTELNSINKRISETKEKLAETNYANRREYLNKLLSKLNEAAQLLIDNQLLQKKLSSVISQHIELLESYIKDPSFKTKSIEPRTSYNFEILQKLNKDILNYEEELTTFVNEKPNIETSLEANKKELISIEKELKSKEKEQKKFSIKNKGDEFSDDETIRQKAEMLDLEIKLLKLKKQSLELKLKEDTQNLDLINNQIFSTNSILALLKNDQIKVEHALLISESDLENEKKELDDKKSESTELQAKYTNEISRISLEKENLKKEFERISKKYNIHITDIKVLSDWSIEVKNINQEMGIYELGQINDRIITYDREIELKEVLREFEKTKIQFEEISFEILNSWYKISQRKFKSEDELNNEIKKYDVLKFELNKKINEYKDKITNTTNQLNNQSKIINNLKKKIKYLNQRQEKLLNKFSKESIKKGIISLNKSEELINQQTDLSNKIIEKLSSITGILKDSIQQINVIIVKLKNLGGVLLRSEYALSWQSFKNIISELNLFAVDSYNIINSYITTVVPNQIINYAYSLKNPQKILQLILLLLFLLILFFLIKKILPTIYSLLLSTRPALRWLFLINCLIASLIGFIYANFFGIFIWSLLFAISKFEIIPDLGFKVIFYLSSIVYLCYLANKFIKYLLEFNKKYNYVLMSQNFQKRFRIIFLIFIYSTITIFFFKEAFITITYERAELPTILLALYSIIFSASLIFLIGKDEILSVIPHENGGWKKIRSIINNYYYIFLSIIVSIIIISDRHIGGFSKLVSYIFWGILGTALLLTGLWWLQTLIRRISSAVFFSTEDDSSKERFQYAKAFYGLFSVVAFILFILLAFYIGAKIWGYPISLEKFSEFLNIKLFNVTDGDQITPITLRSFITIFSFLVIGFVIAWVFDRFILRRMFSMLLVGHGVQNTISNVSYYTIVVVVLLVGFLRVGLGGHIPVLVGILIVGLAFALKGPANDFIGYFIILIERSVKIGDYIEVDESTRGFVRKITPRTVVLRRRNSVSIIVPNSKITNTPFYNWNYVTGFIAFKDIHVLIPFSADPEKVREILLKVLDDNPNILKSPNPVVRLENFDDSGFDFLVRGYLSSIHVPNQWNIASQVRVAIVKALRENKIEIASPIRIVKISSDKIINDEEI